MNAILFFSLVSLLLAPQAGLAQSGSVYEIPPVLDAAELLKGEPLTGEHFVVDRRVPTDGFLMTFTVQSEFGVFHPRSPDLLAVTLVEIAALVQLEKIYKSELFVKGFKKSGKEIGQELKTVVTKPVQTVKGIGAGVGRFFQRTYRTTKTGVQKLGDKAFEQEPEEQASANPGSKLPGAVPKENGSVSETNLAVAGLKMTGNTVVNILGYSEQRRQLAKQLRVDPYTTNKVLAEKLDEVAWAAFAGGLGVRAIKMAVPASMALSVTTTLSDWTWDVPVGDLKVFNENKLLAMGVDQGTVDRFLRHRWHTITMQGRLVRALDRIGEAENRPEVIALALTVTSDGQARFVTEAVEMLAHFHEQIAPLIRLEVHTSVIGRKKQGGIVIPAPLDYVSWTKQLDRFTSRNELKDSKPILYLRGRLSVAARKELGGKGWRISENVLND
ncbi:hypothetical protein QUF75_18025 [Desulfococcaceae bacterium HSG7]|nr:hypothetical protein [Desulfococcaceae bacterium HSG7]